MCIHFHWSIYIKTVIVKEKKEWNQNTSSGPPFNLSLHFQGLCVLKSGMLTLERSEKECTLYLEDRLWDSSIMISRLKMEILFTSKENLIFPNYPFCQIFKIDVETIRVKFEALL